MRSNGSSSFLAHVRKCIGAAQSSFGWWSSGTLEIDFRGEVIRYPEGSGIFIPAGPSSGHKARSVTPIVRLVLVEDV